MGFTFRVFSVFLIVYLLIRSLFCASTTDTLVRIPSYLSPAHLTSKPQEGSSERKRIGEDLERFFQEEDLVADLHSLVKGLKIRSLIENLRNDREAPHPLMLQRDFVSRFDSSKAHRLSDQQIHEDIFKELIMTFLKTILLNTKPLYYGESIDVSKTVTGQLVAFVKEQKILVSELEEKLDYLNELFRGEHSYLWLREINQECDRMTRKGNEARKQKKWEEAETQLKKAVLWSNQRSGFKLNVMYFVHQIALNSLGTFYTVHGNSLNTEGKPHVARETWQKAIEPFKLGSRHSQGNPSSQAMAYNGLGRAYLKLGRLDEAMASYSETFKIPHVEDQWGVAVIGQAEVYIALGNYPSALDKLNQVKRLSTQTEYGKKNRENADKMIYQVQQKQGVEKRMARAI